MARSIVPLKSVVAALVTVNASNCTASALLPTLPVKVTLPNPASTVRLSAAPPAVPLVVPLINMLPAPAPVDSVGVAACAITRFPPIVRSVFVVVMFAARFTSPVVLNAPVEVMLPVAFLVSTPLLVNAVVPPEAKLLFTLNAVPVNAAEPTFTAPVKVVATLPALCVNALARSIVPLKSVVAALVTVNASNCTASALLPTLPVKVTLPNPASTVRLSAAPPAVPLVVPLINMLPAPAPVDSVGVAACAITRFPPIVRSVFVVVMFAARFTSPVVLKPAGAVTLALTFATPPTPRLSSVSEAPAPP